MQNVTPQTKAQIPDHPDVVIFPPLILACALAFACLLQAL